ncbi:hypothetical protein VHEMI05437 [[Torrubiella] hemipterigena]|uniref:Amidohydrolase 3 domain-containing protein n=1 Tax=[Torrubiella] hemipterigena TaxID=1531966 RepID=A0A0A1TIR9_9HYPO|nr:hypothetical protein VHEMI05437 [[Torrubiella] hemipterigena]
MNLKMAQPDSQSQPAHLVLGNGKVYVSDPDALTETPKLASSIVIKDGIITHVGEQGDEQIKAAIAAGAETKDLAGRTVLPGFIDGHLHILQLGQGIQKVVLDKCTSLEDIRQAIKERAEADPHARRIFCKGWMHSMTPEGVDATLLDDVDPRPIFVDTKDMHTTWCNTAGLKEICDLMKIDKDTPDPAGGTIQRDSAGEPNGVFNESAVFQIIWPFCAQVASKEEKMASYRAAVKEFNSVGYTGMVDMAMDEDIWEPLLALRNAEGLGGMRLSAYWLMKPDPSLENVLKQVDRAAELAAKYNKDTTPDCRIVGIKVICDGIIDACTASLREPYTTNVNPDPIWDEEVLHPVVARAHSYGLQVALHAIGDRTIQMAIDVLEKNTDASRRPRIEHLELASEEDAKRLGKLGITASIQPVHSDPAILRAWPRLLGARRCKRAFAYREFVDNGARIALGSDAPTAPHEPLPNLYVGTTRKSFRERDLGTVVNPEFALTVCQAVVGATHGSAYSCFSDEWTGRLAPGLKADFIVCDLELTKDELVEGVVQETWFEGQRVYKRE